MPVSEGSRQKRLKPTASETINREESSPANTERKPLPLGAGARMNARVVFAIAIFALSLWTAASFLPSLIWATILAITLWPLYLEFAARITSGPSGLAALVFTAIVALILFTPMSLAVYQVAQQSDEIISWLKKAQEGGIEVPDWIARLPIAAEIAQQWWRANLSDPKAASAWLQAINADNASGLFNTLGGQLVHRLFMLFFSLFALFVLLCNGRFAANRFLETCDRILGHPGEGVIEKIVDFDPRHRERHGRSRSGRGIVDWRRLSCCSCAECRDVHHFHHRVCHASFRSLDSLRCSSFDIVVWRRQRDCSRCRILLGSNGHAGG